MKRTQVWAGLAIVLTVSLAGCGGAADPQWTYAPAPPGDVAVGQPTTAPASQAARGEPGALGRRPGHPRGDRRRPRLRAGRHDRRHDRRLRGEAGQHRLDPPRHHVPGRHDHPGRRRRDGLGCGRRARRGPLVHLLDPRPRRCGHEGHDLREGRGRGRRQPRGPAPATDVQPDANAPKYAVHDPKAPALLAGDTHDIDLVIEEKLMTVADGLQPGRLDLRRIGPGPGDPGQAGRPRPDPPQESGHEQAPPQRRLPQLHGGVERRDDLDQPGRGEALRVPGRVRGRLDVPLRHGARRSTTSPTACTG